MENENKNTTRSMMNGSYGDNKMDKSKELSDTMSIKPTSQDEYTRKINNIGGSSNA